MRTRKQHQDTPNDVAIEAEVQKWLEFLVPLLADKFIADRLAAEEIHPAATRKKAK